VSQLSAIESRAVLTRDGFGRYASSADSIVFVSHRWDGRREPDPTGMQLKCLKSLAAWLDAIGHADAALWYDYWSLPQPPLDEPERGELLRSLQQIPDLLKSYAFFRCPGALELYSHATRAWCLLETGLANAVVIPADDNVGAMLATWLWSTPANRRAGLVVAWEEIWAAELAGVGGFDDLRLLAWIGLAERRGDPMTDKASLARQVLDDLATNPLPSELRSLLMRCTVASDVDLVLDLWRTAAH
jgi:hypothetical protein